MMQGMKRNSWLWSACRSRAFVVLMLLAACVGAGPPERPDAVVITDPEPQVLCTLFPLLAKFDQPALLVHAATTEPYVSEFLAGIDARRVWLIDPSEKLPDAWRQKFQHWPGTTSDVCLELVRQCWPAPAGVVLVDGRNSNQVVAGSLLASARRLPAFWLDGAPDAALRRWLDQVAPAEIICVGQTEVRAAEFPGAKFTQFESASEALAAYAASVGKTPIEHLVAVGSTETKRESTANTFVLLATQYAVAHQAAVAFVDRQSGTEDQLRKLTADHPALRYVTLWGDAAIIPDEEADDPVAAAGLETRLTEPKFAVAPLNGLSQNEPCQFRLGRITGDSLSSLSLVAARNLKRAASHADQPSALILANTDYDLPLMEAITRTTAQTFERTGWKTRAMYGWQSGWYRQPNRLWGADIVLYEGHTANLANSVRFDFEREPVHAGLYVFQGCKTLRQPEVSALLRNGAVGVVGTTTNTYSASGSSLAKAYIDCLLLDQMDAGTSLMVSRNFMLAMAELKERRGLHQGPRILRGGMTFSLWGDPTWKPPMSPANVSDRERVHATRRGNLIELNVPETFAKPVKSMNYVVQVPFGAKLAGMYEWEDEDRTRRQLPPLYFAIVPLPDHTGPAAPIISTPVAKNRWTSLWDSRNQWLYLLVQSGSKFDRDQGKSLHFRIEKGECEPER